MAALTANGFMQEQRGSPRITLDHEVLLSHPAVGTLCLRMRDMSADGVFLRLSGEPGLEPGMEVVLQVCDLEDAPQVRARVVRLEAEGVALHYLLDV